MSHSSLSRLAGSFGLRICALALAALLVTVALSLLLLGGQGCGSSGVAEVKLDSGPVKGVEQEANGTKLWVFKGIPYAAPPVGDLRWRPPQPVKPWTEVRLCDKFGPSCPQPSQSGTFYLDVGPTNEDCLYLNVWTPAKSPKDQLPVMVWIHGGSFETGSGSMAVYDGANLASLGVVVVTINYRLGPLGFLAHPALSSESPEGVSGNYGLLDQIAALKWVRRNIAGFGGDPNRVTVFGESAGAISILDLLVSPLAKGLFSGAICESPILLDQGFGVTTTAASLSHAEAAGADFAAGLGVDPSGDLLAQMRQKTPEELLARASEWAAKRGLLDEGLVWKPVADGFVLPEPPTKLWVEGKHHQVPLIIGTTADEGNLFVAGAKVSAEEYVAKMKEIFGEFAEEALRMYPAKTSQDVPGSFSRMLTEVGFASTARFAARMMCDEAPTYVYQFTRVPLRNPMGAFHGVEIPYVFGTMDMFSVLGQIEPVDRELSKQIMGYWTRFAASGDPNGKDAPAWPRYDAQTDQHLELGDTIKTGAGLHKAACDFADKLRGLE